MTQNRAATASTPSPRLAPAGHCGVPPTPHILRKTPLCGHNRTARLGLPQGCQQENKAGFWVGREGSMGDN